MTTTTIVTYDLTTLGIAFMGPVTAVFAVWLTNKNNHKLEERKSKDKLNETKLKKLEELQYSFSKWEKSFDGLYLSALMYSLGKTTYDNFERGNDDLKNSFFDNFITLIYIYFQELIPLVEKFEAARDDVSALYATAFIKKEEISHQLLKKNMETYDLYKNKITKEILLLAKRITNS